MNVGRIGLGLPIMLWPVIGWFTTLPDYALGRHSAPALHSVQTPLLKLASIFSGIAAASILLVFRSRLDRFVAFAAILANLWLLLSVIDQAGLAYA